MNRCSLRLFWHLLCLLLASTQAAILGRQPVIGQPAPTIRNLLTSLQSASQAPKKQPRKDYLALAKNTLSKTLNRKLAIDKLMDKILVPRYDIHPLIMPMSIPQISDPRITVQTFNPPPKPLAPGMLPKEDFRYRIDVPNAKPSAVAPKHHVRRTLDVFLPGQFNTEMSDLVEDAFKSALSEHLENHPGLQLNRDAFKFNIFDTSTERRLKNAESEQRLAALTARVARLNNAYRTFRLQIADRFKNLGNLLKEAEKVRLDFVTD